MDRSAEYAGILLKKALGDQHAMRCLAADRAAPEWAVGFHAQQAVEKAIKAVLCSRGVRYARTHDLSLLLDALRRANVSTPPDDDRLCALTPFGVAVRYDDEDWETGEPLDVPWALRVVEQTLDWARRLVPDSA